MNHTWGYKSFDNDWKSVDEILEIKERVNSHGVNLLLNVGPDYLGRIPAPSVEILKETGRRTREEDK
jgi:alpha-L-fucosidase